MKLAPSRPVRRLLAGLTPIVLAAAALPLLAPTCGTFEPGVKSFSRSSLIIPMDVCYQCTTDGDSGTSPSSCGATSYVTPTLPQFDGGISCPQATDAGDVIKAYGLVYQLIRAGVAVYWSIDPDKTKLDQEDFNISYSGGPAFLYDWSTGGSGAAVTQQTTVRYRGGPFIVDGSDYAKASQVMQTYKATFGAVNVHVANVAFEAPVARTMAGGWSAGGTIPPKLALLDIGSDGAGTKNSEIVIRGYLIKAGLDFVGAGGTSADGQHGQIYDRLTVADFLPSTPGDWTTTKLYRNGYQILWVPHWSAPTSCSDCTTSASTGTGTCPTMNCPCDNYYSAADVATVLKTIGSFNAAGKDVFAECAGLGSFEGVATGTPPTVGTPNTDYGVADATTHFQTQEITPLTGGVWINKSVSAQATYQGGYASPFMQMGDFVFRPYTGAIQNYQPTPNGYEPGVARFLSETNDTHYDIFTVRPAGSGYGTSVYLGGHSYSGCDGTYQTAGTRLVLNTLFNLGASCVESGVTCSTGKLGVCAAGAMTCSGDTAVCEQLVSASAEICNGLDDDCNGLVDDLPVQACYDGDTATKNVGLCREGVRSCVKLPDGSYGMSSCVGQVLPAAEVCNALDDDCDGAADESLTQACYFGPSSSVDPLTGLPLGACQGGTQTCDDGNWGACLGQVLPSPDVCGDANTGNGIDEDCDGALDEECGCSDLSVQECYGGPAGTAGVGPCVTGEQTCTDNAWGECVGQVLPTAEICGDGIDQNCNGSTDDPIVCNVCPEPPQECYEGPAGTQGVGVCAAGERVCSLGVFGACGGTAPDGTIFQPQILPSEEICDGQDNDCDGTADEGPPACPGAFECVNGACVPEYCNPAEPGQIDGYYCDPATSSFVLADCGTTGAPCDPGLSCLALLNLCVDPCATIQCGAGNVCGGGKCTGGSCYSEGCDAGQICRNGACVADPCTGVYCPGGTFCRDGDCVQSCVYVTCGAGQRCAADGFCEVDPCAGVACTAGTTCIDGACVTDPCAGLSCGDGQECEDGACVDKPCAWIDCPVGVCFRDQCYSAANPTGAGTVPPEEDAGGCGCTTATPNPGALLLGLLLLPLARRRREARAVPRRGGGLLALLLAAGLTATLAGCPSEEETADGPVDLMTDEANCGQVGNACDPGEICVDGWCGPGSPVAPYITTLSPPDAAKGTTDPITVTINGDRFQSGAIVRVTSPIGTVELAPSAVSFVDSHRLTATLDVSTAAEGILYLRVRNPDLVRSNAEPFYVNLETPHISSISPTLVEAGTDAVVHVTGTGLNATSQCFIKSVTFPDRAVPTVLAGGGLDCTLDETVGVLPGTYKFWVRNEGALPSNEVTLTVISNPDFTLTSMSPSSANPSVASIIPLTVFGTGFDPTCRVKFDLAYQSTAYLDSTSLYVAQLQLAPLGTPYPDGTYNVTVDCGGALATPLVFTVSGTVPQLTLVSPQTAFQGTTSNTITFTGTNFASGTYQAQIRKQDATWHPFDSTTWSSSTLVTSSLSLSPAADWPDGEYQVRLQYPDASLSASFPFRVLSNTPTLRTVTPAGAMAGTNLTSLAVTGSNFVTGIQFKLRTLAGVDVATIPVLGSPAMTQTTASIGPLSLASRDTGTYQLVASNTGSALSNALSFSITPGPPTITGRTPTSAVQSSTPVTVVISGTNFAKPDATGSGGSLVMAWNSGTLSDGVTPIIDPASPINVANLSGATVVVNDYDTITVTLDTRSVLATSSPYTIQVWNPGGPTPPQKSGTTTFTVSP